MVSNECREKSLKGGAKKWLGGRLTGEQKTGVDIIKIIPSFNFLTSGSLYEIERVGWYIEPRLTS